MFFMLIVSLPTLRLNIKFPISPIKLPSDLFSDAFSFTNLLHSLEAFVLDNPKIDSKVLLILNIVIPLCSYLLFVRFLIS